MKTKEELDVIKKEVESLNSKLSKLTDEELEQVIGGETASFKLLTRRSAGVVLQTIIDEPSKPEKQYCQMIACQYTKESCINKNIGIDNFYCDKFHQFVKDFD